MNFVLVHFLAKVVLGSGLLAVQIVSSQIPQEKEWSWIFTSVSKRKLVGIMDHVEDKQSAMGRKGLSYRKSYSSIGEHDEEEQQQLQSIEMRREGSSGQSSIKSQTTVCSSRTESVWSKDDAEEAIPGQPLNFGTVVPGVYRSSYPQEADYPFLEKLGLKTIM